MYKISLPQHPSVNRHAHARLAGSCKTSATHCWRTGRLHVVVQNLNLSQVLHSALFHFFSCNAFASHCSLVLQIDFHREGDLIPSRPAIGFSACHSRGSWPQHLLSRQGFKHYSQPDEDSLAASRFSPHRFTSCLGGQCHVT